ncbi:hypothetical protein [Aliiruegeria lutimaris]|uniref:Type IV pilus biogenesis protein PilP n=1 Tax=Aliiruegeria lutimaris TaxID=571298 RepID=A0A1G9BCM6_9RHOB|nr:hypothetical protein [Aliiruegeria lutimaris]SDK37298.1 hypothetical protein SAMN04488026_103919 [Aliiruegeria lutimaris]
MTPNFSLILDHDGISLLYRQDSDWRSLGSVSLDAPDFDAQLEALRQRAEALSDGIALRSTLVLPNSQILYASTEAGKDARENARLAGRRLDGATPYALGDLVYDWKVQGNEILIAAVARETLEEAEGFAQLHGFAPLSFTAAPEDGSFPGAPFFGPSDAAPRLLAPGEVLERIARPILSSGPYEEPRATPEPLPEPEPESTPVEVPEDSATSPEPVTEAEVVPEPEPEATDIAEKPEPAAKSATSLLVESETSEPASEPAVAELPVIDFVSLRASPDTPEAKATETPPRPLPPVTEPVSDPEQPEPRVDVGAEEAPEPAPPATFSSIRSRVEPPVTAAVVGKSKNTGTKPKQHARSAKPAPAASAAEKTARKRAEPVLKAAPKPAAASAAPNSFKPGLRADKVARDSSAAAAKSAVETGGFRVPPAPPPLNEAEALTVFGARKSQQPQQSPSRLALIAAAGGAVVVGLIGLWAFLGSGGEDITATDAPAELITEAPSAPQLVSPETGALPDLAASDTAPTAIALAPASATPEPETGLATQDMAGDAEATSQVSGAAALPPPADDGAPEDLRQPAIQNEASTVGISQQETLANLSTSQQPLDGSLTPQSGNALAESLPEDSVAAPMVVDPTPLDPISALAAYTVSGIWQRAPERSQQALEEETEEYYIASIDPTIPSQDAYALPTLDRAPDRLPRAAATPVVPEPEPDPAQASDALDGEEIAPDGVEVVRGKPSIVPPRRPADLAPAAQSAPETAPETGVNPAEGALRGERPRSRPEGLIEANERATFGGNTRSELAEIRPNARPRSVQETAEALDAAVRMADAETVEGQQGTEALSLQDQALALDLASATRRAVANSPQPRLRPSNISQIADRARKRAEQDAQAQAEAEQQARDDAQAAALSQERAVAAAARKSAEEAAQQEAAKQAAAAQAAKEKEEAIQAAAKAAKEEERAAKSSGPAVPRSERANPTGTTSATVAKQATVKNQISLSKVSLIGVYGTSTKRRALVRLPSGKMLKVKVGDRIDGGRVAAIGTSDLRYQKGGRTVTLKMPKG